MTSRDDRGVRRPDFRIPETINPPGRRCIQLAIPDDPAHLRILQGLLSQLAQSYNWQGGTDAEKDEIREVYQDMLEAIDWEGDCPVGQVRFTAECGLEYSPDGVSWEAVPGWETYAPTCFAGEPGEPGEPGIPGIPGADGENLYLRELLAAGLQQANEPTFAAPTLIHAYYRADALRPATSFYGQSAAASVHLHNAADVLKLSLGIVGANNELDTRESKLLMRFGAGATNNRQIHFNADGTVQIANAVLTPAAKFEVYSDVSALHAMRLEGRTGQANGTSVLHIGAVNQENAGTDGDAIFVRGLNSATATRAPGIFAVNKHGNVLNSDSHILQKLSTGTTPAVYRPAIRREVTHHDMSGSNYRSRAIDSVYVNSAAVETLRQEVIDGEAAISVMGGNAAKRQNLGAISADGNVAAFEALKMLKMFGFVDGTFTLGEIPDPEIIPQVSRCQYAVAYGRWVFEHYYKYIAEWLCQDLPLYEYFEREYDIRARIDVRVIDEEKWWDFTNTLFLEYVNPGTGDIAIHVGLMRVFFETVVSETIYCFLNESGIMTEDAYAAYIVQLETNSGLGEYPGLFWEFMQSFNCETVNQWLQEAGHSEYIIDADCIEFDCTYWEVLFSNTSPDLELIIGDTNEDGWQVCGENVLRLDLPDFHVTGITLSMQMTDSSPPASIQATPYGESDWHYFTPTSGHNDAYWNFNAPNGVTIEIHTDALPEECLNLHVVRMRGLGDAPAS